MAQEIGLSAKFDTRQFTRGLNRYVAGLNKAETETAKTAKSINASTAQITAAWKAASTAPSVALLALQKLSTEINRLGTELKSASAGIANFTTSFNKFATTTQNLTKNLTGLTSQLRKSRSGFNDFANNVKSSTAASLALAAAIGTALVLAFRRLGQAVRSTISEGIELLTFFERTQLALNFFAARSLRAADSTIGLSDALAITKTESKGLLLWLQQIAVESPFTAKDVTLTFRVAQAYGLLSEDAKTLIPLLIDLGSAVGLDAETLQNAARALGQIQARAKLTGEEIRQLGNAGIPIRDILIKQLGIAASEFDPLLEAGAISANITIPALVEALREFEGAGKRVAFETIGGMISAFKALRELALSRFFEGVFQPLREGMVDLVNAANDFTTIAWFRVLGEEVGKFIKGGIERLIEVVKNLIDTWKNLDPELKKTIVTFATSVVVFTGVAVALGTVALAARLIIRPFTLIIVALAALNTAWQLNIGGFRDGSQEIIRVFSELGSGIGTVAVEIFSAFAEMFGDIADLFNSFIGKMEDWGISTIEAFAIGLGVLNPIIGAIGAISAIFSFFLKPSSPPRVAPQIDRWGQRTMQLYARGINKGTDSVGNEFKSLGPFLDRLAQKSIDDANLGVAGAGGGKELIDGYTDYLQERARSRELGGYWTTMADAIETEAEPVLKEAGESVAATFWEGFIKEFPKPVQQINQEVINILSQLGGGRQLDVSGALAIERYLEGFKDADFSALNQISNIVSSRLSSLSKIGDLGDLDVPRTLSDTRDALAQAIDEFRDFGSISESTFKSVRDAAGPAGDATVDYLSKYFDLAAAATKSKEAQDKLNDTIEFYKNLIRPIRDELEALQRQTTEFSEQREMVRLTRVVSNFAFSELRRKEAQAKIDTIRTGQRLRGLEDERDGEIEVGEARLDEADKIEKALKDDLSLMNKRLTLQNKQLQAVAQEATLIERLNKELERVQKREQSDLDLQLKFAKLLSQEERDRLGEMRARHVLNQADSTEFEKQQAILKLQTIELDRQRRDMEAVELGFDPALFQPIRDAVITLGDLNIKTGDADDKFDDLKDTILDSGEDMLGFHEKWVEAIEGVRGKYEEVNLQVIATVNQINDSLPDFLKLFPTEEGAEPPIIKNLREATKWILILGGVMASTTIIIRLAALKTALVALGVPAIFAAIKTGVLAIAGFIGSFGAVILLVTAIIAVSIPAWITNFVGFRDRVAKTVGDTVNIILGFVEFFVNSFKLLADITIKSFTKEGRKELADDFKKLKDTIQKEGFLEDQVINVGINFQEGKRGNIGPIGILGGLTNTLNEALNSAVNGIDSETITSATVQKIDEAMINASDEAAASIVGLFTSESFKKEAVTAAGLAGEELSAGFINGLVLDKIEAENATSNFAKDLIQKFNDFFGIKSPSTLMANEIGEPIAQGILEGIKLGLTSGDIKGVTGGVFKDIQETAKQSNTSILNGARTFNTIFKIRMKDLVEIVEDSWETISTSTVESWNAISSHIRDTIKTLTDELPDIMQPLVDTIVGIFVAIREGSGAEVTGLVNDIQGYLITNNDSLLALLQNALVGTTGPGGQANKNGAGYQLGVDFVTGIALGINDPTTWTTVIQPAINTFTENLINAFETGLGISSPSLVAAQAIGLPFADGIALGIRQGAPFISAAVQSALDSSVGGMLASQYAPSGAASSSTVNNNSSREYNYNLNVNSSAQSQGVIRDFRIMQTMTFQAT